MLVNLETYRKLCPYGQWTCPDGREVLFNRHYWPILERYPGQSAKPAKPGERINFNKQDWFFDDGTPPWFHLRKVRLKTLARINTVLRDWGLRALPEPPRRIVTNEVNVVMYDPDKIPARVNPWLALFAEQGD